MTASEGQVPDQTGGESAAVKRAVAGIMRVERRRRRGLRVLGWIGLAIFVVALLNAPGSGHTTVPGGSSILMGIIVVLLGFNGLIGVALLFRFRVLPLPLNRWRRAMRAVVRLRRAWRATIANRGPPEPEESHHGRD